MVNALPQARRNLLNTNKTSITLTTDPLVSDQYRLHFENEEFNLEKLESKALYNKFISKISTMPTTTKRHENLFNSESFQLDWKKDSLHLLKYPCIQNYANFNQFKILNRILYTNDIIFKMNKIESPLCYLCGKEPETVEHLLFYCPRVQIFWDEVNTIIGNYIILTRPFHIKDVLFGMESPEHYNKLVNDIILESTTFFIYVN